MALDNKAIKLNDKEANNISGGIGKSYTPTLSPLTDGQSNNPTCSLCKDPTDVGGGNYKCSSNKELKFKLRTTDNGYTFDVYKADDCKYVFAKAYDGTWHRS